MLNMRGSLRHRRTTEAHGASWNSRAHGAQGTRATGCKVFGSTATRLPEITGAAQAESSLRFHDSGGAQRSAHRRACLASGFCRPVATRAAGERFVYDRSMALTERRACVGAREAGRIDRIVQALTGRSRGEVRGLFDQGGVSLNGEVCAEPGMLASAGDVVLVRHDPHIRYRSKRRAHESTKAGRGGPYRLVFEDSDLIVVDKAPGVLTVPTDHGETNTLLDAICRSLGRRGHRGQVSVVQRLDRGTSGLLVFGKNPRVGRELAAQFRVRKAQREYAAIVAGRIERPSGTFESRLATARSLRRYSVRSGGAGEQAVTHYRVVRRMPDATFVRVTLETGRRNQIRVHFAEAGHPILGDERYSAETARHPRWRHRRLALHASVLGFTHPRTDNPLRFESPLPAEFEAFFASMRTKD
jgi:23S rRNA pseudouridine1911/1915/1917 synthase